MRRATLLQKVAPLTGNVSLAGGLLFRYSPDGRLVQVVDRRGLLRGAAS